MHSESAIQTVNLELLRRFLETPSSYFTSTIVFFIVTLFYISRFQESKNDVPIYGQSSGDIKSAKKRYMFDSLNLVAEGYQKFRDKAFQIWTTEGHQVVLPPRFIDEVKMLPNDTFDTSLPEFLQCRHHGFGGPNSGRFAANIIKHDLNKSMANVFPSIIEELDHALPMEFPVCNDWTPLVVYPRLMRTVCRTAGMVFVGPSLNRTVEWIKMSCEYTVDVFAASVKLKEWHPMLRYVARYFLPEVRRIIQRHKDAARLLIPVIKQRELEEKSRGYEKPQDAIEWTRDTLPAAEKSNYGVQAVVQLTFGAVSIHTTTQAVTHILYDLATHPEYLPILREEARYTLNEAGGEWTLESMNNLKKLDSFMKESQRHSPAAIVAFQRKVNKPITLSDGTYLKAGTLVSAPAMAINYDPALYTNPEEFDGLRFYKKRQLFAEDANKHQFVSTSNTQVNFGGGRHACPGRWLASHEIKMIAANLILQYDVKLKDGQERPKNVLFQAQYRPDPTAEILFKNVET